MFVECLRLVLNGVSSGNQSVCRICILIEEMLEWVKSLDTLDSTGLYWKVLERVIMPGRLNVMNDWNVWNAL